MAKSIDLAIILPVAMLVVWLAGMLSGVHLPESQNDGIDFLLDLVLASDPALLGLLGLLLATASLYFFLFQVTLSQTPGMRITGLHIIDHYGDDLSLLQSLVRTVGYSVGIATLGLGFAWIAFDAERRGLHDWLSQSHVVKS